MITVRKKKRNKLSVIRLCVNEKFYFLFTHSWYLYAAFYSNAKKIQLNAACKPKAHLLREPTVHWDYGWTLMQTYGMCTTFAMCKEARAKIHTSRHNIFYFFYFSHYLGFNLKMKKQTKWSSWTIWTNHRFNILNICNGRRYQPTLIFDIGFFFHLVTDVSWLANYATSFATVHKPTLLIHMSLYLFPF